MAAHCPVLAALPRIAARWGARLLILPDAKVSHIVTRARPRRFLHRFNGWHHPPFATGNQLILHWPSKTVLVGESYLEWHNVLHDIAHCVATTTRPEEVEELDFFGWEWAAVKVIATELGLTGLLEKQWIEAMGDYGITGVTTLGALEPAELDLYMLEATQRAVELGLVDLTGHPIPQR